MALRLVLAWPDVAALETENPETTAFIDRYRDRRGAMGTSDNVAWRWAPASAISPHVKRAVVAAEDMEFFTHRGFSTSEIKAAIRDAVGGQPPRGASTITQQLAKNLWLSPSRNPLRKLREAILTRQLERHLSKDRILELYLNVVEFGPGVYGVAAAARLYFGKPPGGLTEHEAALLAASLPQPTRWNPSTDTPSYRRYVADIESRMDRADFLWRWVGEVPPPRLEVDTFGLRDVLGGTVPSVDDSGRLVPNAPDSAVDARRDSSGPARPKPRSLQPRLQ
jgi:monofunctional biosynthetic peptidoglycan transglycosylase